MSAYDPPPRLCIEAHVAWGCQTDCWVRRLRELGTLRTLYEHTGVACSLVRVLRVRRPLPHYVSFYTQFVTSRQGDSIPDPYATYQRTRAGERWTYGVQFLSWANRSLNLQAHALVGKSLSTAHGDAAASIAAGRQLLGSALDEVDLLLPMEEFTAMLVRLSDVLHIPLRAMHYYLVQPKCLGQEWATIPVDEDDPVRAPLEARVAKCSNQSHQCHPELANECHAVLRRVAPLDAWLYELARNASDAAYLREPTLGSRVVAFEKDSVGIWRGGLPTPPVCKLARSRGHAGSVLKHAGCAGGGGEGRPSREGTVGCRHDNYDAQNPPALRLLSGFTCVTSALVRDSVTDL